MAKPHVTRTLGPIHFEDLDPHRFEDLVRQLAYDFRTWKSIESTGRGGADDGFDVRAFEEVRTAAPVIEDEVDSESAPHPMEGNLWMIQCKREKEVGPKKVATIIADAVKAQAPPYGYILAAPVHFSKAAHDRFREELRSRGVMEFYLWGAGELEDMLFQPKNDHVLFAFFGISLVTKRRSRVAAVRSTVLTKNKLLRVLGEQAGASVLIRDLNDEHYPFEDEYADFEKSPQWKEYQMAYYDPRGLVVVAGRYFAYFDREKKEWDCTRTVQRDRSFIGRADEREQELQEQRLAVRAFWEQLPRANRVILVRHELIRFDQIDLIDEKGDDEFKMPHVYVQYDAKCGPYSMYQEFLEINQHSQAQIKGLTRTKVFPGSFAKPGFGTIHTETLTLDTFSLARLEHGDREITLYGVGDQYSKLQATDVAPVEGRTRSGEELLFKVTNVRMLKGRDLLPTFEENPTLRLEIERQIGRAIKASDKIRVVEAVGVYRWQIDQNRPVL